MRWLELLGYETFRTAGSHGVCDVIAVNHIGCIFIQVKFNCDPTPTEIEQFKLFATPQYSQKCIYRWDKRKREPRVTIL